MGRIVIERVCTEVFGMDKTIYLKCSPHSKVKESSVFVKDVAEVFCDEKSVADKVKSIRVTKLKKVGSRKVISVLFLMKEITKQLPGIQVENIGETDIIVEWEKQNKLEPVKIAFVSLIAFFGTGFTIMAFHNDIGIRSVFEEVYHLTKGSAPEGVGVLEASYCLGLFLGITVFFNHIGRKKLNSDPTPVAVAMHNYERDVNQAIIENAERRGIEEGE